MAVKFAVTVQAPVTAPVLNVLPERLPPQVLEAPVSVYPEAVPIEHDVVLPLVTGLLQFTVPPFEGLATPVTEKDCDCADAKLA